MAPASPAWVSGELLEFASSPPPLGHGGQEDAPGIFFRALIECRGGGKFAFALPGHPYRRLRLSTCGQPEWDPGPSAVSSRVCGARESSWSVEGLDAGGLGTCITISIASKKEGRVYLAPVQDPSPNSDTADGALAPSRLLCVSSQEVRWHVAVPLTDDRGDDESSVGLRRHTELAHDAGLSEADLRQFVRDGYAVVSGAVPADVCATAKAFINGRLGMLAAAGAGGGTSVGPVASPQEEEEDGTDRQAAGERQHESLAEEAADPAGEEHVRHPLHKVWGSSSWQLMGLCRCAPMARRLEQLIGRDSVDPHFGAQVALRFPGVRDDLVAGGAAVRSRVTGRDWHTDGLRQGKKHPFTLLIGVALSDTAEQDQGNLCVWPGSHYFAQASSRWPDGRFLRARGWERTDGPLPDIGEPLQLRLRAGDVMLAHSELAHCGGPLLGPDIRYMVYFRAKHRAWRQMREQGRFVDDMWCDLGGLIGCLGDGSAKTPHMLSEAEQRLLEAEEGGCSGATRMRHVWTAGSAVPD